MQATLVFKMPVKSDTQTVRELVGLVHRSVCAGPGESTAYFNVILLPLRSIYHWIPWIVARNDDLPRSNKNIIKFMLYFLIRIETFF